jgi:hypothetical protein
MILIDYSQVFLSNLFAQFPPNRNTSFSEDLIRHTILSSILFYKKRFSQEYGELVLCTDSKKYWRKDIFPFYKSNRKRDRAQINVNWTDIFNALNKIKLEIKDNFPYKVIEVDGAEADDVIAILCKNLSEKTVIISSDKDYLQLQSNPLVKQYSPKAKRFLVSKNAQQELKEKIIRGDKGDGIPNFLSPDNSLALGIKQKSIMSKKVETWLKKDVGELNKFSYNRFDRNARLIDFNYIPKEISESILIEFTKSVPKQRQAKFNYFIDNELKQLMEHIQEF